MLRQFTHPPFEAVLYAPFASVPFASSFLLWTYFSLACLGGVFFVLRPYGPELQLPERLLLLSVAFFPVFACIVQGQDSLLALLAFTLAFSALKQSRTFQAGLFLGLALIKPQIALPMLILLARRGGARLLSGFAAVAIALVALSMLVFGPDVIVKFPEMLLEMNRPRSADTFHLIPAAMMNLRGAAALLLSGSLSPFLLKFLVAAASLTLFAWAFRESWHHTCNDGFFAFAMLVTLLISFHLLIHDAGLIVLPAFLFLSRLQDQMPRWNLAKTLAAAPLVLFPVTILGVQMAGSKKMAAAAFPVIVLAGVAYALYRKPMPDCKEDAPRPSRPATA